MFVLLNYFLNVIPFVLTPVGKGDDLTQKVETRRLNAKDHEEYRQQKGRAATNKMAHEKALRAAFSLKFSRAESRKVSKSKQS